MHVMRKMISILECQKHDMCACQGALSLFRAMSEPFHDNCPQIKKRLCSHSKNRMHVKKLEFMKSSRMTLCSRISRIRGWLLASNPQLNASPNSRIKNTPFISLYYSFLAYSLYILCVTNVVGQRGDKESILLRGILLKGQE